VIHSRGNSKYGAKFVQKPHLNTEKIKINEILQSKRIRTEPLHTSPGHRNSTDILATEDYANESSLFITETVIT
jgi:hypothetical protein